MSRNIKIQYFLSRNVKIRYLLSGYVKIRAMSILCCSARWSIFFSVLSRAVRKNTLYLDSTCFLWIPDYKVSSPSDKSEMNVICYDVMVNCGLCHPLVRITKMSIELLMNKRLSLSCDDLSTAPTLRCLL